MISLLGLALAVGVGCGDDAKDGGDAGTGGTGGTGGSGGSAGTGGGITPGACDDLHTNRGANDGEDFDYGCLALDNTFGFEFVLNVCADTIAADSAFEATFSGFGVVSGAFIAGAEDFLMLDLNTAEVAPGASIPVTATGGAAGDDVVLTMETVTLDLDEDTDGDTEPGPYEIPILPGTGTYTAVESGGESCFNYANPMTFTVNITEPFFLPAGFTCQPANQDDINADEPVITPEPATGEVCVPIP